MITRNTYTQGKGELAWDTWPIRLVLKLSLQSGNETNDPLKSGPALAGPAGLATPPLQSMLGTHVKQSYRHKKIPTNGLMKTTIKRGIII